MAQIKPYKIGLNPSFIYIYKNYAYPSLSKLCKKLGLPYNTVKQYFKNDLYRTKVDDKEIIIKRAANYEIEIKYKVGKKSYVLDSEMELLKN